MHIVNIRLLRRTFIGLIVFVFFFVVYLTFNTSDSVCYFDREFKDKKTLPNVMHNLRLRSHDGPKNIFFHETSCTVDGIVRLNSRQACAVESSALINPNHEVFLLFTSQVGFRNRTPLPIIDALLSYPNVHFNYLNLTEYAEHTPLNKWMKTGELFRSQYVNSHTSGE
jgi:lactosylceramide 4-alpha-galactosyltransferase